MDGIDIATPLAARVGPHRLVSHITPLASRIRHNLHSNLANTPLLQPKTTSSATPTSAQQQPKNTPQLQSQNHLLDYANQRTTATQKNPPPPLRPLQGTTREPKQKEKEILEVLQKLSGRKK
jgi:hypothetical protein